MIALREPQGNLFRQERCRSGYSDRIAPLSVELSMLSIVYNKAIVIKFL